MPRFAVLAFLLAGLGLAPAASGAEPSPASAPAVPRPASAVPLRFSIVKTGESTSLEGLLFCGGNFLKPATIVYSAVLVEHPAGAFLFDTGLGRRIDVQFRDMTWWAKPLFAYGPVVPARDQLERAGGPAVETIYLSHGHWDHASGLVDFPEAEVRITEPEQAFLAHEAPPRVLRSQVDASSIRWKRFDFDGGPFASYARSFDCFGDGSAVLVPLAGHTPGSTGLFLTVGSGRQYFLVGDAVWKQEAARRGSPKAWPAGAIVDADPPATTEVLSGLRALMAANPGLVVVPAHDGAVQDALGYFPHRVE